MIWAAVDYGALSSTETHRLVCFHRILHGVERQSVVLVFVFVVIIFALEVRVWCMDYLLLAGSQDDGVEGFSPLTLILACPACG